MSTVITSYSIHYTKLYDSFNPLFPRALSVITSYSIHYTKLYDALIQGHVAPDPVQLLSQDRVVVVLHEPVRAYRMPAQGVSLESYNFV